MNPAIEAVKKKPTQTDEGELFIGMVPKIQNYQKGKIYLYQEEKDAIEKDHRADIRRLGFSQLRDLLQSVFKNPDRIIGKKERELFFQKRIDRSRSILVKVRKEGVGYRVAELMPIVHDRKLSSMRLDTYWKKEEPATEAVKGNDFSDALGKPVDFLAEEIKGLIKEQDITESEEFKEWFGDSASVDNDGNPLVFIHDTNKPIEEISGKAGRFGGIFATLEGGTGYGKVAQKFYVRGDILNSSDLRSAIFNSDDGYKSFLEKELDEKLTDEQLDDLSEAIIEESIPDESLYDVLRTIEESDSYAEMQRLRGLIAKNEGADAVTIEDEQIDSYLLLPGSGVKSAKDFHNETATEGVSRAYEKYGFNPIERDIKIYDDGFLYPKEGVEILTDEKGDQFVWSKETVWEKDGEDYYEFQVKEMIEEMTDPALEYVIKPEDTQTLWYENSKGKKWLPDLSKGEGLNPPKGYIYQVSKFPNNVRTNMLREVLPEEVEKCKHPEEHIRKTYGWVDGMEGRECALCKGTQLKKVKDEWPEKWEAHGSRDVLTMSTSWTEEEVMALVNDAGYSLHEAIQLATSMCGRCLSSLLYDHDSKEAEFAEFSIDWFNENVSCKHCEDHRMVPIDEEKLRRYRSNAPVYLGILESRFKKPEYKRSKKHWQAQYDLIKKRLAEYEKKLGKLWGTNLKTSQVAAESVSGINFNDAIGKPIGFLTEQIETFELEEWNKYVRELKDQAEEEIKKTKASNMEAFRMGPKEYYKQVKYDTEKFKKKSDAWWHVSAITKNSTVSRDADHVLGINKRAGIKPNPQNYEFESAGAEHIYVKRGEDGYYVVKYLPPSKNFNAIVRELAASGEITREDVINNKNIKEISTEILQTYEFKKPWKTTKEDYLSGKNEPKGVAVEAVQIDFNSALGKSIGLLTTQIEYFEREHVKEVKEREFQKELAKHREEKAEKPTEPITVFGHTLEIKDLGDGKYSVTMDGKDEIAEKPTVTKEEAQKRVKQYSDILGNHDSSRKEAVRVKEMKGAYQPYEKRQKQYEDFFIKKFGIDISKEVDDEPKPPIKIEGKLNQGLKDYLTQNGIPEVQTVFVNDGREITLEKITPKGDKSDVTFSYHLNGKYKEFSLHDIPSKPAEKEKPVPAPEVEVKELWEMTLKEWMNTKQGQEMETDFEKEAWANNHRTHVIRAFDDGKKVPAEVLMDYPELIETGVSGYEEKKEARIERLEERAVKATQESESRYQSSKQIGGRFEAGQPILVGHHSEAKARRDQERMWSQMEKSVEAGKKAERLQQRATSAEMSTAISSDDPEAVVKLKEKLQKLETDQKLMKDINAAWRKFKKNPASLDKSDLEEKYKAHIRKFEPEYTWQKGPFESYQMSNNNANIKRTKERLKELIEKSFDETTTLYDENDIQVIDNVEENRVQVFFPGKPSAEIRKKLSSSGFNFSRTNGAWQRKRSSWASQIALDIVKESTTS